MSQKTLNCAITHFLDKKNKFNWWIRRVAPGDFGKGKMIDPERKLDPFSGSISIVLLTADLTSHRPDSQNQSFYEAQQ
jgi:hypothetical protein